MPVSKKPGKPELVKKGLARMEKGKLKLSLKGKKRLALMEKKYDRVSRKKLDTLLKALKETGKVPQEKLPGIISERISVSGKRLSLARLKDGNVRLVVVKGAFFPHTVTRRQYFFTTTLQREFTNAINRKVIKPTYYEIRPVKYLAASGKFIVSRYYSRPSAGDVIYEFDRKKILNALTQKRSLNELKKELLGKEFKPSTVLDLAKIKSSEATSMLKNMLSHKNPEVRGFACYGLALSGLKEAAGFLNKARVSDPNAFVRWRAAVSIYLLEQVEKGKSVQNALFRSPAASLFISNNPNITSSKIQRMFNEFRGHFNLLEPIARKKVRENHGYKTFHADADNISNILLFGFDGKEKFRIGIIDQG